MPDRAGPSQPVVALRPAEPGDLPTLFAFESDPRWRVMTRSKPRTRAEFDAAWARAFESRSAARPEIGQRAILADGTLCGAIGCRDVNGRLEIGYGLGPAFWGRGIASRALGLLLAEVTPRPLYAAAAASNLASIRVLEKHGFAIVERRAAPETERTLPRDEVVLALR